MCSEKEKRNLVTNQNKFNFLFDHQFVSQLVFSNHIVGNYITLLTDINQELKIDHKNINFPYNLIETNLDILVFHIIINAHVAI